MTFRIYYNGNAGGIVALNEGKLPPKISVKKITRSQYKQKVSHKKSLEKQKTIKKKPPKKATPKESTGFGDDLFKELEDLNK